MNRAIIHRLQQISREVFSSSASQQRYFFSPGRVNLIGDHIDYCGGLVLPAAIQFGTYFLAQPNDTGLIRVVSLNRPGLVEFDPKEVLTPNNPVVWDDYVKGVVNECKILGMTFPGLDIALGGDIPGNGLSSSASLEMGIALILKTFGDFNFANDWNAERRAMSWLSQRAESQFVGVNCGIMDQAVVALARADHAMLLDCNTLAFDYIPVLLQDCSLLILNTCKDRSLIHSAYNQRRREVDLALAILKPHFGIERLCELTIAQRDEALDLLTDSVIKRRCRHVINEQSYVHSAVTYLQNGNLIGLGEQLNASHLSLQCDYEVTGLELDTLIGLTQQQQGVLGARMTGAGFGGCGVAIVQTDKISSIMDVVISQYEQRIGYPMDYYPLILGDCAHEIDPCRLTHKNDV